jgi:hypothetical protein
MYNYNLQIKKTKDDYGDYSNVPVTLSHWHIPALDSRLGLQAYRFDKAMLYSLVKWLICISGVFSADFNFQLQLQVSPTHFFHLQIQET